MNDNKLSIKDVCVEFELSPVYVRRMIQRGEIKTELVPISEGSKTEKHLIDREEIIRWRSTKGLNRTNREDGRMKFVLYADSNEIEQIQKLLESNQIESIITRANKVKETN